MFEKFPAARMNQTRSFAPEPLLASALQRRAKRSVHDHSTCFPSYFGLFDILSRLSISESSSGTARLFAAGCGRFAALQAHVAFL
jgi:hypothetical protein